MDPVDEELTEEQVGALDAEYKPFPSFADWSAAIPRQDLWDEAVARLGATRESAGPEQLRRAVDFVMRAAALDTGAIEGLYSVDRGFTITVAEQAAAWQGELAERGENALALFEAQLRTYELILDVATQRLPVTEAWIRTLHEKLTAPQETYIVHTAIGPQEHPLPRGVYKQNPNHVRAQDGSWHAYAPVRETAAEMHRLIEEITSGAFETAHPVLQAAYAHYGLVAVHPFADGNGRVARALASTYLYRSASVPLLIFEDQKFEYFGLLHAADLGEHQGFTRFVWEATLSATNLVIETMETARGPRAADQLRNLHLLMTAQGGLTHQELDQVAKVLVRAVSARFNEEKKNLPLPPGVNLQIALHGSSAPERPGFRRVLRGQAAQHLRVTLASPPPASGQARATFHLLISQSRDESETFLLVGPETNQLLQFGLRDVHPELTIAAEERLRALATRTIGDLAAQVTAKAEHNLRKSGYGPDG